MSAEEVKGKSEREHALEQVTKETERREGELEELRERITRLEQQVAALKKASSPPVRSS